MSPPTAGTTNIHYKTGPVLLAQYIVDAVVNASRMAQSTQIMQVTGKQWATVSHQESAADITWYAWAYLALQRQKQSSALKI